MKRKILIFKILILFSLSCQNKTKTKQKKSKNKNLSTGTITNKQIFQKKTTIKTYFQDPKKPQTINLKEIDNHIFENISGSQNLLEYKKFDLILKDCKKFPKTKMLIENHLKEIKAISKYKINFTKILKNFINIDISKIFHDILNMCEDPSDIPQNINISLIQLYNISSKESFNELIIFIFDFYTKEINFYNNLKIVINIIKQDKYFFQTLHRKIKTVLTVNYYIKLLNLKDYIKSFLFSHSFEEFYYNFGQLLDILDQKEIENLETKILIIPKQDIVNQLKNILAKKKIINKNILNIQNNIPDQIIPPNGLINLGTTCYMNSLIQLINTYPILIYGAEEFLNWHEFKNKMFLKLSKAETFHHHSLKKDTSQKEIKIKKKFINSFIKILNNIRKGKSPGCIIMKMFYHLLNKIGWNFSYNEQLDPAELLYFLSENLGLDSIIQPHYILQYSNLYINDRLIVPNYKKQITKKFVTRSINIESCDNLKQLVKKKIFYEKTSINKNIIYNQIIRSVREEKISFAIYNILPEILIINIGRNYINKITKKIEIPIKLEFKILDNDEVIYTLKSFISHYGKNTQFGHYNTTINLDDKWYTIDDKKVFYIKNKTKCFKNTNAFLILYKKILKK